MTEKNGGPAFPNHEVAIAMDSVFDSPGMSLRDYFAGQALTGLYLSDEMARASSNPGDTRTTATEFAKAAFEQADAMLAERDRE